MAAGPCGWLDAGVVLGFRSPSRENNASSECHGSCVGHGPEEGIEAPEGEWRAASCPSEPKKDTPCPVYQNLGTHRRTEESGRFSS